MKSDNLLAVLRQHAERAPERHAFSYLKNGEQETDRLSYGDLDDAARAVGAALRRRELQGRPVILHYPPGLHFVRAFFGCMYAGAVAVPVYPPSRGGPALARLASIIADCNARHVLTTSAGKRTWLGSTDRRQLGVEVIASDEAGEAEPNGAWSPIVDGSSVAFLQYTSGSTGQPKGVRVTHANVLANSALIARKMRSSDEDVLFSWLPVYHDMGLVGHVLHPVCRGLPSHLMSPAAFLVRPQRWLAAISRLRATLSGAPNFAYELCLRRISETQADGLDLSSWRVAYCGAEPIRRRTLEDFARRFAAQGLRRRSLFPCYGLAEGTLLATGGFLAEGKTSDSVSAEALRAGRAVPAGDGEGSLSLVSCGTPDHAGGLVIVDPETRRPVKASSIGEIWLRGPSVADGYHGKPQDTERVFGARTADGLGPFLRTGDLGVLQAGELLVTGRRRELIIVRGHNHYPHDIERTVEALSAGFVAGCSAAFAVEHAERQAVVVVQEAVDDLLREIGSSEEARRRIAAEVRVSVHDHHQLELHDLLLVGRGSVPKTSSGKVRRSHCAELYRRNAWPAALSTFGR